MKVWIFLRILYLYRKKVVWIVGLEFGCEIGESVDFSRVWRYWVRYFDFDKQVVKMLDFTGFYVIFI